MPDHKSILSPLPSIPEELTPAEEEAAAKAAAKKEAIRQENLKRSLKEIVDSEQCYGDSLEALIGTLESIISSELASELASPSSRKKMNEILPPLRAMLLLSKKISSELSEVLAKNTTDCQSLFKVLKGIFDPNKKFDPAIIFDTDGKFGSMNI
ncbi:MAG: hypothetical protein KBD23_04695 [Gammaproteobacteria bacterium]|nr:hypothetical protein [Gammaproteobacteria bacterium]MBP9729416.1 hypothetical protein [Gammaproteobacteria bacterium]